MSRCPSFVPALTLTFLCLLARPPGAAAQTDSSDPTRSRAATLKEMSLEDLMSIDVSTVSRKTESWWSAPGAIDVITDEDIRRAGAMSIPDALRMATGLQVSQLNSREWAISARGFDVIAADKMNVQIDGRTVYTPFFSGVLWDVQDTMMEDISRIEVLRGPGGALWGAYAVNGFINILTKPAWETQGWLATAALGTDLQGALAVRYGGRLGADTFYKAYVKYADYRWSFLPDGARSHAPSDVVQAGFRSDTRIDSDTTLTLQGDIYTNKGTPEDNPVTPVSGGNIGTQWKRVFDVGSDVQFIAYYDHTSRDYGGPFYERRDTVSGSLKYRLTKGINEFQVGADTLISSDSIRSPTSITIEPPHRTYETFGVFAQDNLTLVPSRWEATIGTKVEHTNFSGTDVQPTVRLAWTPNSETTWWTAVSRAVRPPVRVDQGLTVRVGNTVFFQGNPNEKSESVWSAELGVRRKLSSQLAVDIAGYANAYDDIRSYETSPTPTGFPWTFGNSLNARTAGVEVSALYQPLPWIFVKASYDYFDYTLTKDPGSRDFQNGVYEGNDARNVGSIMVRTNLDRHWELDTTVRGQSHLPNPALPGFITADLRLGWIPTPTWDISLIARNLFDPQHPEFLTLNSSNEEIGRSVLLKVTCRY